jgi:hypothetical protein
VNLTDEMKTRIEDAESVSETSEGEIAAISEPELPRRQALVCQKVKLATGSFLAQSVFALLDTDSILHLGSAQDIFCVSRDLELNLCLIEDPVQSVETIGPEDPPVRPSFQVDQRFQGTPVKPRKTGECLPSPSSSPGSLSRPAGTPRPSISKPPRFSLSNLFRPSVSALATQTPSKATLRSDLFLGSRYRVVHAYKIPANKKKVALIVDVSLSSPRMYFPNETDFFPAVSQPDRHVKASIERCTQTYNETLRTLYLRGHVGEILEPWDPIFDHVLNSDCEFTPQRYGKQDYCRLIIRVNSENEANYWLNAVNVARYFRGVKSDVYEHAKQEDRVAVLEERLARMHDKYRRTESDKRRVEKTFGERVSELQAKIKTMYTAEKLHELMEEHEQELREEVQKRELLELALEEQRNMTMSLSKEIKSLQTSYEPAVGEYQTISLRYEVIAVINS